MAIESKHHRPSEVDRVMVSQSSRRDARPVDGMKFETYREEIDYWKKVKRGTESELQAYKKSNYLAEQNRIRKGGGNSLDRWVKRRAEMDRERAKLVEKRILCENEIARLKPLVAASTKRDDRDNSKFTVLMSELQDLKVLLTRIALAVERRKNDGDNA